MALSTRLIDVRPRSRKNIPTYRMNLFCLTLLGVVTPGYSHSIPEGLDAGGTPALQPWGLDAGGTPVQQPLDTRHRRDDISIIRGVIIFPAHLFHPFPKI